MITMIWFWVGFNPEDIMFKSRKKKSILSAN